MCARSYCDSHVPSSIGRLSHGNLSSQIARAPRGVGASAWALTCAGYLGDPLGPEETRSWGFVRSYNPLTGIGVVTCNGLCISLDREEAERSKLSVGAAISFVLRTDGLERPCACDIKVAIRGDPKGPHRMKLFKAKLGDKEIDWSKTYVGVIERLWKEHGLPASFQKKDPGYCFISCDETFKMFEHDIWAWPSQVTGFKIGDTLIFKVRIDQWWNYPVAYDIKPAPANAQAVTASGNEPHASGDSSEGSAKGATTSASICVATDAIDDVIPDSETDAITKPSLPVAGSEFTSIVDNEHVTSAESTCTGSAKHWQNYALPEKRGTWWWNELDGDWFVEGDPLWKKYMDPQSGNFYWWKNNSTWFWVSVE